MSSSKLQKENESRQPAYDRLDFSQPWVDIPQQEVSSRVIFSILPLPNNFD